MPSPVPGTRATGTNRTSLCPQGLLAGLEVAVGGAGDRHIHSRFNMGSLRLRPQEVPGLREP